MKKFVLVFFAVFSGLEVANATPHWTGPVVINDIYVWDYATAGNQNYVNVRVTPYYNPENCGDAQGYQLTTTADIKSYDRIYAFLLTAYSTGQSVSLLIDGCNTKPVIKAACFKQAQN